MSEKYEVRAGDQNDSEASIENQLDVKNGADIIETPLEPHLSQILADAHENILPRKKLIIVFIAIALTLFLSFVDQTGITVALPYIADELNAHETISWAGTSMLISTTVFMMLFGRFSDIFSRKYVLVGCMVILALSDLACGFAQTPYQLCIFRGFAGIGNGGITSLSMMIVSDVVTLRDRGKYQGILGSCVGLGNAVGPFLASAFITSSSWRKYYYMLCPIIFVISGVVIWLVPHTKHDTNVKTKLFQIDFIGFFTSSTAIIFLLIPISGGGSTFPWNGVFSITFLVIGGVFLIAFLLVEKYIAKLPMIPLHLFNIKPSLTFLLSQNLFFGICYYSTVYYVPYYLQVIRGYSIVKSSAFMLSLVILQSTTSVITGQLISRTRHYIYVIWYGYICWTVGTCLLMLWRVDTHTVTLVFSLILIGSGIGAIFQPTLVAAQAQSYKKDRSIVISTRNVLRSFGGALGLAISSAILANAYISKLETEGFNNFDEETIEGLKSLIYSIPDLSKYTESQSMFLIEIYMSSLKKVFYFWIGCIAYCLVSTLPVKDNGLEPLKDVK